MKLDISEISLYGRNFKAFGETPQGFAIFKPFNVVVGRNNSGKSALLDLIEAAVANSDLSRLRHLGSRQPELIIGWKLQPHHINELPEKPQLRAENGSSVLNFSPKNWMLNRLTDSMISGVIQTDSDIERLQSDATPFGGPLEQKASSLTLQTYSSHFKSPFRFLKFRRISADRDVQPEPMMPNQQNMIEASGKGLTSSLAHCLNAFGSPRELVEDTFLAALNEIFGEAKFTRLSTRQYPDDSRWEVFLHEQHKGEIPLSQSGSGIKTILLTLANLLLVPVVVHKETAIDAKWIFGFEELENNLHPAVQRRLFKYLRTTAENTGCRFVITTHSNVVIDMFSHDEQAQILHVKHDSKTSTVSRVDDSAKAWAVLDDIDVRASDILQSNCIVWVEGPSDRYYFRKWVELWSDGTLQEGVHYQCLPFGGSCNAHLSFDDPEQIEDLLAALKLSRNALLLVDSDRSEPDGKLKPNTDRLIKEIETRGGYAWLTAGREVENYIPQSLLKEKWQVENDSLEFADVLDLIRVRKGNSTSPNKASIARDVCKSLTREQLESMLDMKGRLDAVCQRIRDANGIVDTE